MINIDFDVLNPLERQIHQTLCEHSKSADMIRITKAAELCGCSVSKISKFAKKLGFKTYKQYLDYLYGRELREESTLSELARLQSFIREFDHKKVSEMVELINRHQKVVLFGYGSSLLCAQYFEYRLRTCTSKVIVAVPDDLSVASMIDKDTLLLIFTVTGSFKSFDSIYRDTKKRGGEVTIVIEEYNPDVFDQADNVFCLTQHVQPGELLPYEKSRTVFFIFMEEVIRQLSLQQTEDRNDDGE